VMETKGADFGWPECYYDYKQKKLVLAPEYGGDGGKKVGLCAQRTAPVAAFPAHWAPNDMQIYLGSAFPDAYKGGAFIAFHGSWNRAPLPQGGYNIVFQPMKDGKADGQFVVFADGFAAGHKEPGRAAHRPTGIAFAPDGAMYIADDQGGRIYRVTYSGSKTVPVAAAPAPVVEASASANGTPPEGLNPDAGLGVPPGGSPDQVSQGGAVYRRGACAGCHGSDGKGSAIGADLTSGHYLWGDGSVASIQKTIQNGVPKPKEHTGAMPPEGGIKLTQADLVAVSQYVWALGHQGK
jgi:mono/diheme cytochrome c family protein